MSTKHKPATSNAEPMEFVSIVMPNRYNERGRLAREADELDKTELVERARTLGIPSDGSKEDITARVKDAARTD